MKDRPAFPLAAHTPDTFPTISESVTGIDPRQDTVLSSAEDVSFLRLAMDGARMGAWKVDLAAEKIYWSFHHHALFDVDPASFDHRTQTFLDCVHPEDRERVAGEFWEAVETGRALQHEFRVVWRDGTVHWICSRGTLELGTDGGPGFFYGVNWDVTEKNVAAAEAAQRDAELREARELLEAVTATIPQLVWVADANGYVEYLNSRWFEYTGQTAQEATGAGWLNALHRDDRAAVAKRWSAAVRDEGEYDTEYRLRGTDGEYRWFMARGMPVRDGSGKIAKWFGTSTDITERKVVEERREESERESRHRAAELRAILDAVPAVTFIAHDAEGREITGNRIANEFLGIEEGTNASKLAPENAAAFAVLRDGRELKAEELPVQQAASSGLAVRNVELEVRRADGTGGDLFGHAVPLLDEDGKSRGAVGAFLDVTELKRVSRELEESNARFRSLFESDGIGFLISALDGRCIESNDAFLGMVGYTREDLETGKVRWLDMTPPEDLALDYTGVAEVAERGSCTPYEKEYIRKDGTRVPVLLGYTNLRGTTDQYVAFVLDLTAQKRAESEAREREQQFKALADSLPELVYVLDGEGKREFCNRTFFRYTGTSEEDLERVGWQAFRSSLVHPDDVQRVEGLWKHSLATGEPYENETRLRRHDGKYRTFLSRALPVRDESGSVVRWVASGMDVHDHKLAEDALRRSEKLAAAGRLASSIAHEINNPLQAVTSLVYLLGQDALLSDHGATLLRTAEQELTRMSQTVTQALRFTRSARKGVHADLRDLADSALEMFHNRLTSANIRVEREYEDVPTVKCNSEEIRQVIAVLLSNARDAMLLGGRLRVRVRPGRRSDSPGVWLTVADTGHGISDEMKARMFEPFVTTKEATGTGLGLWVASEILRRHGGHISVRSKVEAGTVAMVFVPGGE